jgi:hypothetical protein
MTHHHSMSFELTHGKSAKLFNPVSPIARRESAMLSPERCGVELENKQANSNFAMSGGVDMGDANGRPRSRGETPKDRAKSRVGSMMFAEGTVDKFSRPSSRSGLIPLGQLFSSEERKYQQNEEDKRIQLEQEKMKDRDYYHDNDEGDKEEEKEVEDDSWFLNSFCTEEEYERK